MATPVLRNAHITMYSIIRTVLLYRKRVPGPDFLFERPNELVYVYVIYRTLQYIYTAQ